VRHTDPYPPMFTFMPFPTVPDVEPAAFLSLLKYLYTFGFMYCLSLVPYIEPEAFLALLKYPYCYETQLLLAFMYIVCP
jgi:hypothetical protein